MIMVTIEIITMIMITITSLHFVHVQAYSHSTDLWWNINCDAHVVKSEGYNVYLKSDKLKLCQK